MTTLLCSFLKNLLLAYLIVSLSSTLQASENLFPEGNFEVLNSEGKLEGWKLPHPGYLAKLGGEISVENDSENHFLRIKVLPGSDTPKANAELDVPHHANQITLKYRLRTKNLTVATEPSWAGGFMGGHFLDEKGNMLKPFVPAKRMKEDQAEWVECEDVYEIPKGAIKVVLQPGLYFSSGTLDVDDVQIFIP